MKAINRKLLPVKAHFFFFMAAMGPILPQLSVFGKQIGVAPEVMGYITSILPLMYVIAKPIFGFVADYFGELRKLIFVFLIMGMSLSYAAFYFIPQTESVPYTMEWTNATLKKLLLSDCLPELLADVKLCNDRYHAYCYLQSKQQDKYEAYFINTENPSVVPLKLPINYQRQSHNMHVCLINATDLHKKNLTEADMSCELSSEVKPECVYYTKTFWLFVLFMCVGTIGFNVANSISDAICFDMLGADQEHKYGSQRVWGTIGFGLAAIISGYFVDIWTVGDLKSFTPALIVMLIFSGFDILSISKLKLPRLSSSESIFKDIWDLVCQPAIATFLVFTTLAGVIDSFIIYFMFWHVEEVAAETGYVNQIKFIEGCVVAAECLAGEVLFFFQSGRIIKKLGYIHCMSMCFFFYAVRLFLISWIPNPWYLVGVEFFFQGCTYALCYTCIVAYSSVIAPPGTSATVQGLIAGMDDGLGYSIGSFIGGLLYKKFGGRRTFKYFSIVAICMCIMHMSIRPHSRQRQQQPIPTSEYKAPQEQDELGDMIVAEKMKT